MTATPTFGNPFVISGPLPKPPDYTLLDAVPPIQPPADGEAPERWGNGVEVWPYPVDLPSTWLACVAEASGGKATATAKPLPRFAAFTIIMVDQCNPYLAKEPEFRQRLMQAYAAVESYPVEREFMTGTLLPDNPSLFRQIKDDGTLGTPDVSVYPAGDTAQHPVPGLAYLENAIAATGKQGIIHCSPAVVTAWFGHLLVADKNSVLVTHNGTTVIPGYGYQDAGDPDGHTGSGSTAEWAFATGLLEIRRGDPYMVPGDNDEYSAIAEATDRTNNLTTFRYEREYLVDWDTTFQAGVLIDWSLT